MLFNIIQIDILPSIKSTRVKLNIEIAIEFSKLSYLENVSTNQYCFNRAAS